MDYDQECLILRSNESLMGIKCPNLFRTTAIFYCKLTDLLQDGGNLFSPKRLRTNDPYQLVC